MITLKAICLAAGLTDCGIVTEVYGDGKPLGKGLVTFAEVSAKLSNESGLKPYLISKEDFEKIFNSNNFQFDVTIVLPNDPDNPIPGCKAHNFQFVTKWKL
jgi:hypothetical protein